MLIRLMLVFFRLVVLVWLLIVEKFGYCGVSYCLVVVCMVVLGLIVISG